MYNKHNNVVDLASKDFLDVMAYLRKQGVPNPDDIDVQEVGIPTGLRYVNKTLIWTDQLQRPDPFEVDAYMVMNFPSAAARLYRGWAGLPPTTIPEYEPPKEPEPTPDVRPKLAHEGEPGYVKRTNGFFVWWEKVS